MSSKIVKINCKVETNFADKLSYAIDFGSQCTLIGDHSSAVVLCPSVSSAANNAEAFTPKFASPILKLQPENPIQKLVGYGTIANNATIIFNNDNNSGSFSLYSIDPLATVSAFHHSADEINELGCHAYRILNIKKITSPAGSMKLLHFCPIGGVSAVVVAAALTSDADSQDAAAVSGQKGDIFVGCIKNVPALVGAASSQCVSLEELPAGSIDWFSEPLSSSQIPLASFSCPSAIRTSKNAVSIPFANGHNLVIEQNSLLETISSAKMDISLSPNIKSNDGFVQLASSASSSSTIALVRDLNRPVSDDCCFCMMELFPTDETIAEPESIIPAVSVLACGHGYHRQCLQMDLSRVDEFIKQGRYFRFRRLGCSVCSGSMRDALRFPVLEEMFVLRSKIDVIAKQLDSKIGGSSGDDESLDDRLKRHLFYSCNKCKLPFYGGPYDCGATLTDPQTKPENLVCDECCDDFRCPTHGSSHIVYKCQNCWNPAIPGKRFLGRLRLCTSCFETQKGKPVPSDEITPFVSKNSLTAGGEDAAVATAGNFAAPAGTPFAELGKDGWAVCGHDAEGRGLSVAGCSACDHGGKIPSFNENNGKEKSPDAAEK